MSFSDLSELLGNMGVTTRTGPLRRCNNCGEYIMRDSPSCACNNCPIRQKIHQINKRPLTREQELMKMLRIQTLLLGLIISKSGKCIGYVDNRGNIKHCDASSAVGPYWIYIKPTSDAIPYAGTGEFKYARTLGQCVDVKGKTIAEIVRKNNSNHIALTKKSRAPVIAMVLPGLKQSKEDDLDQLIRESKALIENAKSL
jgi:hypothetical protein